MARSSFDSVAFDLLILSSRWFRTTLLVVRFKSKSVRLRQRKGASEGSRGFCVEACRPIKSGEIIHELTGYCPSDRIRKRELTDLSVIRVASRSLPLLGPLRFINHRCSPNCEVRVYKLTLVHILIVSLQYIVIKNKWTHFIKAKADIAVGEEIFVSYGSDYFEDLGDDGCVCEDCKKRND